MDSNYKSSATETEAQSKQFGRERNETLAGQVSLPSPFQHEVMRILTSNKKFFEAEWTGSIAEELYNQDFLDAEEAI